MRLAVPANVLLALLVLAGQAGAAQRYVFEALGEPVRSMTLGFQFVTQDPDGYHIAWTGYEGPGRQALLGVRTDNGELIWVDLKPYGTSHIQMTKARDGNLYLYSGNPGHFLKYDAGARELIDLGVPAKPASYWLGSTVGPDGRFYVGSYPATHLVCLDPGTGKIEGLGRIATDERECYIIHPTVSDENVVYCPVGLHHMELWAYDTKTGTKRQVLPEELTKLPGSPSVWTGTDGQVYGQAGGKEFLCTPEGIEVGQTQPARRPPPDMRAGDKEVGSINEDGKLALTDANTGEVTLVQTQYEGRPASIYSVSCGRDGKIWGGSGQPATTFYYDTKTGELANVGRVTGGRIQVYDTISLPQGLFLSSYTGAHLNVYDPDRPREGGVNPRAIATLSASHMQERPYQWALGPDGMLYIGTRPIKGHLGGALVRVNPDDLSFKVWRNIIPNQSILYVAPVPETNEMLCASSVSGGSSAIPTEKEACIFLWDIAGEEVTFPAHPLPGTRSYGMLARARTGVIYGLAGEKYYAFDPKQRKVVHVGDLPGVARQFPGMYREPVGPKGLIYGFADDALFAIDPSDHGIEQLARHPTIEDARGPYVTQDGTVYYGSGATLMRCRAGEMARRGFSTTAEQARYLLSQLSGTGVGHDDDWVEGKSGVKTLQALKNGALVSLLVASAEAVVPYVEQALRGTPAEEERRREALEYVLREIRAAKVRATERARTLEGGQDAEGGPAFQSMSGAVAKAWDELRVSFRGSDGIHPSLMSCAIRDNKAKIDAILGYAKESDANTQAVSEYLCLFLRAFADRFRPGAAIDDALLAATSGPIRVGAEPWNRLSVASYVLLEIAKVPRSPPFTARVLGCIRDAMLADCYLAERAILFRSPELEPNIRREKAQIGGFTTSVGGEMAWCCEQFMVHLYLADEPHLPHAALSLIQDYCEWRREGGPDERDEGCLEEHHQHGTMEWVRRLIDALPSEAPR